MYRSSRVFSRFATAIAVVASLFTIGCASPLLTSIKVDVPAKDEDLAKYNFNGAYYFLPRGFIDITISRDKVGNNSMTVSDVTFVPNSEHLYRIEYKSSIFSTDKVIIQTTSTGLLLSVATTTTDESGALVKKVVELATEAAKAAFGILFTPAEEGPKQFTIKLTIDPTDDDHTKLVNKALKSKNLTFTVDPLSKNLLDEHKTKCLSGICYRPAIPYMLSLNDNDFNVVVAQTLVLLPNNAIIASIDVSRRTFITNKTTITFLNGMLTKLELDKPSEALAFMGIPIDAVKAIVSIPSAILDFKVTSVTDDTRLVTAQQSNLTTQASLIEAQKNLLAAQTKALEQLTTQ